MTTQNAAKAFAIFAKYGPDDSIAAEHDIIYAGPEHDKLSPEDLLDLDDLGWSFDHGQEAWTHFT